MAQELVGVLDVGAFSARLVLVERGGSPVEPALVHKTRLRLDRALDADCRLSQRGIESITEAVRKANRVAAEHGAQAVFPFATSSVRDAANARQVVAKVARATGTELRFLSGRREAELSFVAARRWYGAAAGPLVVLDVGGGTVEIAAGAGEVATFARSLKLGAREMTRAWLSSEQASAKRVDALRAYTLDRVREALDGADDLIGGSRAIGCSKVLRQLARLAGARPQRDGDFVPRTLHVDDLRRWIPRLAKLPADRRAELPGISRCRSRQALAGAIVAEALLTVCGEQVDVCPWSTTEGLLLTMLDGEAAGALRVA
ncbi:exopolyphosphatase/guanosine-5'-triphosphate,3'-diphosphate pyrophosphatase [Amycolatopsis magusensis]|uniref:Exopolyphosphatase/guanosine-5'-triphosphate, 3'-diphosphate pyrophosphatase n=1 Tax=Amycolatopsis magusensis TaxID=882444 RepID=A0ABS4PRD6_9PSEU|nr:exopolyphosphatase/guanosine-5'-triphosphate,3'-diphosphate pyrophosphatase [Amycolatopsis magusensis]